MNPLSIYFGDKFISVVSLSGRKIKANIQLPQSGISAQGFEEKVPADLKIVALIQEALRSNRIEASEAVFCLSGKDMIIRAFDIPKLPLEELLGAVTFEAKKYLPFKIEDLIYTFQAEFDKQSQKSHILFMGIKKDTLERYLSIASQLKIKVSSLECSSLSVLRLLKLNNSLGSAVTAFLFIDTEGDESHFMVMENGFPLFNRDFSLASPVHGALNSAEQDPAQVIERMKAEIRSSLDYYNRRFTQKSVKNTLYFANSSVREGLNTFLAEMGLQPKFVDLGKLLGNQYPPAPEILKSYSAGLKGMVKTKINLDLLAAKAKKPAAVEINLLDLIRDLKVDFRFVALGLALCISTYIIGLYRIQPVNENLSKLIASLPKLPAINSNAPYSELNQKDSEYRQRLGVYDSLIKNQVYFTTALNLIPKALPRGAWLTNLSINKEQQAGFILKLNGMIFLSDRQKEIEAIDSFVYELNSNPEFKACFGAASIDTVSQQSLRDKSVTAFMITCQRQGERRKGR